MELLSTLYKSQSFLLLVFVVAFFCNCNTEKENIIVTGDVEGIKNGKIFITDSYYWQNKIVDSAKVNGGHFTFDLKPKKNFEPFLVALIYLDYSNRPQRLILQGPSHKGGVCGGQKQRILIARAI